MCDAHNNAYSDTAQVLGVGQRFRLVILVSIIVHVSIDS